MVISNNFTAQNMDKPDPFNHLAGYTNYPMSIQLTPTGPEILNVTKSFQGSGRFVSLSIPCFVVDSLFVPVLRDIQVKFPGKYGHIKIGYIEN